MSPNAFSNPPVKNSLLGLIAVVFIGFSTMALTSYPFYKNWQFQREFNQNIDIAKTTGKITNFHTSYTKFGPAYIFPYTPEVTFTTKDGQTIIFMNPVHHHIFRYRIGNKATVYYSPTNPEHASVSMPELGVAIYGFLTGLLFFTLGIMGIRQIKTPYIPQK